MEAFIGNIMMFAGNFAPVGWMLCNGQMLSISSYTSLFSIIGTRYGGDGRTVFALPDFRGRVSIQQGQAPGLSPYILGQRGGFENIVMTPDELPNHTHLAVSTVNAAEEGTIEDPSGSYIAGTGTPSFNPSSNVKLNEYSIDTKVQNAGKSMGHYNIPPFLSVNYIICNKGIYPPRN